MGLIDGYQDWYHHNVIKYRQFKFG